MRAAFAAAALLLTGPVLAQQGNPPAPGGPPAAGRRKAPPGRPDYFRLYPPPPPGTVTPTKPPPSTATRQPDLFAPIPVFPRRDNLLYDGALDLRFRKGVSEGDGSYIAAGRLTLDYVRANPNDGDERGGARLQLLAETDNPDRTAINRLRLSELYVFYKFLSPGVSASARAGQFVLPFGLAAVYDTPLQPIQSLYAVSLGLRVDTGVLLEGAYGPYHYAASLTTGAGPNRTDFDSNKVIAFRLERNFLTQSGRIQIGGSMLTGRLPVTAFHTELPASGTSGARAYIDKTRFAADTSYYLEKLTARGEVVFGGDGQDPVWGYFGEASYPFARRLTAVGFLRRWNFPVRPQSLSVIGLGINIDIGQGLTLRGLVEYERDVPLPASGRPIIDKRLVLQTRFSF